MTTPADALPSDWERLRKAALALPACAEGIACKGTSLEARTVEVRGKAFLFLRPTEIRMKLGASLAQAAVLAKDAASGLQAGAGGWVKVVRGAARAPAADVLERWVVESYRVVAPKALVATLPAGGGSETTASGDATARAVKRPGAKKPAAGRARETTRGPSAEA